MFDSLSLFGCNVFGACGVCALIEFDDIDEFESAVFGGGTVIACAIGCKILFCKMKHVRSGFETPDATVSGPGNTFALRINEHGMIMIGVVGSARYGCDIPMASGLFGLSSGVFRPVFVVDALPAVAFVGIALNFRKGNLVETKHNEIPKLVFIFYFYPSRCRLLQ